MPGWLQAMLAAGPFVIGGFIAVLWRASKLESKVTVLCRDVAAYREYLAPEKVAARATERTEQRMKLDRTADSLAAFKDKFERDRDRQWTKIDQIEGALNAKGGDDD